MESPFFEARIKKRLAAWYGLQPEIHSHKECHRRLTMEAPDDQWRCCPYWPRKLNNKWNAREFARRHGCRVPELYWWGRDVDEIPFDRLPDRYVIRPTSGTKRQGIYIIDRGREILDDRPISVEKLRQELRRQVENGFSTLQLLFEEFSTPGYPEYILPLECQCYVFGDEVAVLQITKRDQRRMSAGNTWLTPEWKQPPGRFRATHDPTIVHPRPESLEEMISLAARLGAACGTFMRVDFHASNRGCVFGEFSTAPYHGTRFTRYAHEFFEDRWRTKLGDTL